MSKIVLVGSDLLTCFPVLGVIVCVYPPLGHAVYPDTWQRMGEEVFVLLSSLFLLFDVYLSIKSEQAVICTGS